MLVEEARDALFFGVGERRQVGRDAFVLVGQDERLVVDARFQIGEGGVAVVGFAQFHRGRWGQWVDRDTLAE